MYLADLVVVARFYAHRHSGYGFAEQCLTVVVDDQAASWLGNRDRTSGFGQAVRGREGTGGESETGHLLGEPRGERTVDGFATVEREPQVRKVDVGDASRVLADQAVGHVRRGGDRGPTLGEPVQPPKRRRLKRRGRRLPHVDAAQRSGEHEAQAHVVIQRQPGTADVARFDPDSRVQAVEVGKHRIRRQLHGARHARRTGRALQDRDVGRPVGPPEVRRLGQWRNRIQFLDRRAAVDESELLQLPPPAEHVADAHAREPGHRRMRPLVGVGAPDGAGGDRHRDAGLEGAEDGRDEFDGGLVGQAECGDLLVEQPVGDVLRAGVHLWPGVASPGPVAEDVEAVVGAGQPLGKCRRQRFHGHPRTAYSLERAIFGQVNSV